jgi:hypothetical protein
MRYDLMVANKTKYKKCYIDQILTWNNTAYNTHTHTHTQSDYIPGLTMEGLKINST